MAGGVYLALTQLLLRRVASNFSRWLQPCNRSTIRRGGSAAAARSVLHIQNSDAAGRRRKQPRRPVERAISLDDRNPRDGDRRQRSSYARPYQARPIVRD